MPNRYLYLPFSNKELMQGDILQMAQNWQVTQLELGKSFKIIVYGDQQLSQLSAYDALYVLGHGENFSPNWRQFNHSLFDRSVYQGMAFHEIPYCLRNGNTAISMAELGARMKADGLWQSNYVNIKLWFCDLNHKAEKMAQLLMNAIQHQGKQYKIDYYLSHLLLMPIQKNNRIANFAKPCEESEEYIEPESIVQSLYSDSQNSFYQDTLSLPGDEVQERGEDYMAMTV